MLEKELVYIHNDKEYKIIINRKRMRSVRYTYKDGVFRINAPMFFVTQKQIMEGLDKYANRLIKADVRSKASGDDYMYLLGNKITIRDSGEISFTNGEVINYKNRLDLEKKLKKWFLTRVTERVRYYENVMGVRKPYAVHVKKMATRYGSNSCETHSLSFSTILMHFTYDVIDSVIVHELAHDFVRDHSNKFYNVVYKYCPDYDHLHKRLRKGEFQ